MEEYNFQSEKWLRHNFKDYTPEIKEYVKGKNLSISEKIFYGQFIEIELGYLKDINLDIFCHELGFALADTIEEKTPIMQGCDFLWHMRNKSLREYLGYADIYLKSPYRKRRTQTLKKFIQFNPF